MRTLKRIEKGGGGKESERGDKGKTGKEKGNGEGGGGKWLGGRVGIEGGLGERTLHLLQHPVDGARATGAGHGDVELVVVWGGIGGHCCRIGMFSRRKQRRSGVGWCLLVFCGSLEALRGGGWMGCGCG